MENKQIEILSLIEEKKKNEAKLASLLYGAQEIREQSGKQYLYVHFREGGLSKTRYAGEVSPELVNLILTNGILARQLKAQLRNINRTLKELGYSETSLDEKVLRVMDYAKRHLVDSIYQQAVLEGIAATFADTETILADGKVHGVSAEDVLKINNLKHAWQFILDPDVISYPSDYSVLTMINKLIEEGFYYNAGRLRSTPVSIGGTHYIPPLPIESVVVENLTEILTQTKDPIQTAISALLYITKAQLFLDGNKRTAVLFANHILISHGVGIIVIPEAKVEDYKKFLIAYYEGKDEVNIRKFLIEECLRAI